MARIRSIKPEFFKSDDVAQLPLRARVTWVGLWTQCDDHGRMKDDARLVKADVWPLDDDVTLADVEDDLDVLAERGRIVRYDGAGMALLAVANWHHHQRINRPSGSRYDPPSVPVGAPAPGMAGHCGECWAAEMAAHGAFSEGSHGRGKEGKGGEGNARAREAPPSRYCPDHPDGTRDPCGACARAREALKAWRAGRRTKNRPAPHPYEGDDPNTCTACPLPPSHEVHRTEGRDP